jgi:hypothetical protein
MTAGAAIPVNLFYTPCVYNSRVSSIIPSTQPVRRPKGVYFRDGDNPIYGRSEELDYELEMGYFVSNPIEFGSVLNIAEAEEHIFSFVLLNDWSARDLQLFEMNPLGPFHGKGNGNLDTNQQIFGEANPVARLRDFHFNLGCHNGSTGRFSVLSKDKAGSSTILSSKVAQGKVWCH